MLVKLVLRALFCLYFLVLPFFCSSKGPEPVARFTFNNKSCKDEITGHTAKLRGVAFTADRFNNPGNAVFLSGNFNSSINLGSYSALKPKVGSISLWVRIDHIIASGKGANVNPILLTKNAAVDDFYEAYAIYLSIESGRLSGITTRDSLRQISIPTAEGLALSEWYHLVLTYDNVYQSWYVNGKLERRFVKNYETVFLDGDSVMIGSSANRKNERYLHGTVDDIAFYDRVLSESEVLDLYHAPNPNKNKIILQWVLICLGLLGLVIGIYFFVKYRIRQALKKERQKQELRNLMLETELRVNRALMNPHFVFNSMNTLQNLILGHEYMLANDYLVKFSRLMRRILESNMSNVITLEFEIELLNRYLEIEALRFEENIQYSIHVAQGLVPSAIKIPVMMLQPFVENAIWHGLLKKQGEKLLSISFSLVENNYLLCCIEDNGVGRKKSPEFSDNKSLATRFIQKRLGLLNELHQANCTLQIEDKPAGTGTVVKILLPILND